jgi:hypothetical protein
LFCGGCVGVFHFGGGCPTSLTRRAANFFGV